jgi:hypothetical protein
VTSVPEITRMIARIEDWKGQGPVLGRAEAARRLEEAHKLLEEVANMLGEVGGSCWAGSPGEVVPTGPAGRLCVGSCVFERSVGVYAASPP